MASMGRQDVHIHQPQPFRHLGGAHVQHGELVVGPGGGRVGAGASPRSSSSRMSRAREMTCSGTPGQLGHLDAVVWSAPPRTIFRRKIISSFRFLAAML